MPTLTAPLQHEGALVDVRIGWSAVAIRKARATLRPIPPSMDLRALIDSGAESTCLDSTLIRQLGLPLAGFGLANLPAVGGITPAGEHDAGLTVLHPSGDPVECLVLPDMIVLDLPIGQMGYQAVIGRDILIRCRFVFDGPAGRFDLTY